MAPRNIAARPIPASIALSTAALTLALLGCQRGEPLPADKTAALIKPVARVEVIAAPAAPAAPAPATAPTGAEAAQAAGAAVAPPDAAAAVPATPAAAGQQKGPSAGGRMVLGEIAFEGAAASLPADAGATIEAVAGYVTSNAGVRIEILAHADGANADLAKERSQAVRAALQAGGVKDDQISTAAPAAGDAKAAQRVDILLAGSSSASASSAAAAPAAPAASADAGTAKANGKGVYDKTCVTCHGTGVAGAPKIGDKGAWAPRIATGIASLMQSATKGKGAMPPKGGNSALADSDIRAAIEYMIGQSR